MRDIVGVDRIVEVIRVGGGEGDVGLAAHDHGHDIVGAQLGNCLGVVAGECRGLRAHEPREAGTTPQSRNTSQYSPDYHFI